MEFVNLTQKIDEAGRDKLRNVQLFGTDNFRSWLLYFEPGDGTPRPKNTDNIHREGREGHEGYPHLFPPPRCGGE